ncbi:hypothetical protein MMC29_008173, partial [Sticta canariensis]|nr:hypothetical protein [Sticta canariensis]
MTEVGQKIDNTGFEAGIENPKRIATGVVMGFAVILALGRTYIKINKFHRLFIDDVFLILAIVLLVAGAITTFLVLPYNQTEVNVAAGMEAPPPDFTHQLDLDVKFQEASSVLVNASVFCVKFSFLFFFRLLLLHTGKLQAWWWFTFIITIPCAVICMCTEFMVCPAYGDRIMEVCVSEAALKRQIAVLYVVVVLDIFTDVLLVSIPVLLLWSVKINLRRKLGLGSLLCLSIFAIITNIIRAAGHKLDNGQDDVVWILFWLEMEGSIALIANSMTAFRSLFAASNSRNKNSPQNPAKPAGFRMRGRKGPPHVELPTLPTAKISGLRSMMLKDPFEDRETMDSNGSGNWSGIQDTESLDTTIASSHQAQSTRR